jgi:hypothetical protein
VKTIRMVDFWSRFVPGEVVVVDDTIAEGLCKLKRAVVVDVKEAACAREVPRESVPKHKQWRHKV